MNDKVKETLMNAVLCETIKNVQNLFNEQKLVHDDSFFDYELLKAALNRNVQGIVKFLLKIGCRVVNPNEDKLQETPLHLAMKNVKSYTDEVIKKLIDGGASLYDKNLDGETPIQAAFKKGQHEAVKAILLSFEPNSKLVKKDDLFHFHIACALNEYYLIDKFLKNGIDPNTAMTIDFEECAGLTPIQFAIKKSYPELFQKLVMYNGDLLTKNNKGLTPLHVIYYSNFPDNGKSWIEIAFKRRKDTAFTNPEDKYRTSHFHMCCMLDEPSLIQRFFNNGVNMINHSVSKKCPVNPGFTPLHFAVLNGCQEVIELLLKNGADPNKSDARGKTPLHLACKKSGNLRRDITAVLLKYKASPDISDKKGFTSLHQTFYYSNIEGLQVFDTLVSNTEWQSDNCTDELGLSLFHIACTTSNTNQVVKFLDSGVNVDSCVSLGIYKGFTALHFAVMHNQKDVVKILLKRNAKVNVKGGKSGVTPLHLACEFNYMKFDKEDTMHYWAKFQYTPVRSDLTSSRTNQLEIIELLLSHGSEVNAKDSVSVTPLLHLCMIDTNYFKLDWTYLSYSYPKERDDLINEISIRLKEIIEILISNKADVKARTNNQSTVLHIISRYSTIKIPEKLMKFLVISGADVNAVDDAGLTPLHESVKYSHRMLVKRLLKHNANPNIKCKNSRVPLHTVVKKIVNDYKCRQATENEILSALAENGADVNIRDQDGSIMLNTALSGYKISTCEKLLYYGADINMVDTSGVTCVTTINDWLEESEWMTSLYGRPFQLVFVHVQKLLALGLPVNQVIRKCCDKLYPRYQKGYNTGRVQLRDLHNLQNVFDSCMNELDQIKNVKIDSYTSLYDILLKNSCELAKYINNSNLTEALKEQNINKFPLYGFLLKLQYNKGLKRSEVLQFAEAALENVLNVNLPNLCSNLILEYLTNEEVANLKEAAPVKCNLKRKLRKINGHQLKPATKLQKR